MHHRCPLPLARRLIPHARIRLTLPLGLALLACRGEASGTASPSEAQGATPTTTQIAAGEVVIAPPTTPYRVEPSPSPGRITGTIRFSSAPAAAAPASTGGASALCGASVPDGSVPAATGATGAVVWLDGIRAGKALPVERRLELESDRCRLLPRVQTAVVGSGLNVLGHDDFRQHLRFVAAGDRAPRAAVLLGRNEQVIPTELPALTPGLVQVVDLDHPWPRAYIAVFDHPYHAVVGNDGSFTLEGVPPGSYRLRVWHERASAVEEPVTVTAGGTARADLTLSPK